MPVRYITQRSNPRPKPEWRTEPYFAQIQVEAVVLFLKSQLLHTANQLLVVVLSLASSDDLSDTGNQAVHGGYGFSVVVLLHVEGLDLLRIIGNKYGTLEDLLRQIPLVLRLKIASPEDLIIEFIVILFQNLNGLRVGYMAELRIENSI